MMFRLMGSGRAVALHATDLLGEGMPGERKMLRRAYRFSLVLILAGWIGWAGLGSAAQPAPPLEPSARSWNIQCVDCPKDVLHLGDRSMRLDSLGRPHVA
jgi:hypothetical protein